MTKLFARSWVLVALVSACGPMSVMPSDSAVTDGTVTDSAVVDGAIPTPTRCEEPRSLFGEATRAIDQVVAARVAGGFVVAAANRSDRTAFVRAFDSEFNQVGDEQTITSERSTGTVDWPTLSLRFEGTMGVLGFDASVHELSVDSALRVRVVRSTTATQGADSFSVLDASLRPQRTGTSRIAAITRDGSVWSWFDSGFTRVASAQDIAAFSEPVSFHFPDESPAYLSIETRARRDINNSVEIRQFITGHGALLQGSTRTEVGSSISPTVRVGAELVRLHHVRQTSGMFLPQLTLVRHNASTGENLGGGNVIPEDGFATSGALGFERSATDAYSGLIVWARQPPTSANQTIAYQWTVRGPIVNLGEVGGRPFVHEALVDEGGARGWLLYASHTGTPGAPAARVFSRCVRR